MGIRKQLKRAVPALMAGALVSGVVSISPASAAGTTRYVATTGSDAGACTSPGSPCLTVNHAISLSADGDTVNVAAGTYAENVVVNKSLTLRGANATISAGVTPGSRGAESIVKTIRTDVGGVGTTVRTVTIAGFKVDPQGDAAILGGSNTLVQLRGAGTGGTTTVTNNVISGGSYFPNCNVLGCATPGSQMAYKGIQITSGAASITNNRIQNLRYGVQLTQTAGAGAVPTVGSVTGNVITGVSIQGIGLGGASGQQQPGATISGNNIDAVGNTAGPGAIVISNGGNSITGNTFNTLGSGVYMSLCKKFSTQNNTVSNNTFTNAPIVIEPSYDGGQCITGTSGDTEGSGSWVAGGGHFDGFSAHGNNLTGASTELFADSLSRWSANIPVTAGPIDVSCNYWDSATGPTNPSNPGGTGRVMTSSIAPGPVFAYKPWNISAGGACTGGVNPVLTVGSAEGLERDSVTGSVQVPVTLSVAAAAPVVVSFYTVNGTATGGLDYTVWGTPATPRTITIPTGTTQSTINVPVLTDNLVESNETFTVVVSAVSGGGATIGGASSGTGTIIDSDGAAGPFPLINVSSVKITEGASGTRLAQFRVELSRAAASNVTVSYSSANGTAIAPSDYKTILPGSTTFAPGQISKTIDVQINGDVTVEPDETFTLTVAVTGGAPVDELNMTGTATILNDD